jgi:hypothetical protein
LERQRAGDGGVARAADRAANIARKSQARVEFRRIGAGAVLVMNRSILRHAAGSAPKRRKRFVLAQPPCPIRDFQRPPFSRAIPRRAAARLRRIRPPHSPRTPGHEETTRMNMDLIDTELAFARAGASLSDAEFETLFPDPDEDRLTALRLRVDAELDRIFAIYRVAGLSFDKLARARLSVIFVRAAMERLDDLIARFEHRI